MARYTCYRILYQTRDFRVLEEGTPFERTELHVNFIPLRDALEIPYSVAVRDGENPLAHFRTCYPFITTPLLAAERIPDAGRIQ